jgi:hypothetical protein
MTTRILPHLKPCATPALKQRLYLNIVAYPFRRPHSTSCLDQTQAQAREVMPRRSRGAANLPRRPKLKAQRLLPAAI